LCLRVGLPLTSAIAIQDIPKGLAVAMALKVAGLMAGCAVMLVVDTALG
jgi:ZIP family zinc transporter